MPINRIATRADLNELIATALTHRAFEQESGGTPHSPGRKTIAGLYGTRT